MDREKQRKIYLDRNLQIAFSITLMAVMGAASITPAFPKIVQELNISTESVGLLITVFTIPGVILTLFLGISADRYGRKRILVPGLFLFAIAGSLCAFASDFNTLLVLRFFQGIGAASLGSLGTTVIGDLYTGRDTAAAMGYNFSVVSIGTAVYPIIGGMLATIGWNYPFILPILGLPVGLAVLRSLDNPEPEASVQLMSYLRGAWHEIKTRLVLVIYLTNIVTFILRYGPILTFLPILLDTSFGTSIFVIGLVMSTPSIISGVVSSQLPRLLKFVSSIWMVRISFLLVGISMLMIAVITSFWLLFIPISIMGIAQGINFANTQTLLVKQANLDNRAAIMSLNGVVIRIGQSSGPLLMALAFVQWGLQSLYVLGAVLAFALVIPLMA
ncbi:MAG: MFS transporter, partial [Candidatus Thorarchaeota archaeon]